VLARLLFDLSHAQKTGICLVPLPSRRMGKPRVELRQGWVYAVEPRAPTGEEALRQLLKVAEEDQPAIDFRSDVPSEKYGACTPFHPAAVLRNHYDALGLEPRRWRSRLGQGTVELKTRPHPSCLGQDERDLIAFLTRPRTLDEIEASGLCQSPRTDRLLSFLAAVGALETVGGGESAYTLLELPEGALLDEVKRAYRRIARELHPDLHKDATPEALRELERRFAEVSAAYKRLV
jgi:DnaJ-domain-containing protein 1